MISPGIRNVIQHQLDLLFHYVVFSLSSLSQFPTIDSEVLLDPTMGQTDYFSS